MPSRLETQLDGRPDEALRLAGQYDIHILVTMGIRIADVALALPQHIEARGQRCIQPLDPAVMRCKTGGRHVVAELCRESSMVVYVACFGLLRVVGAG